MRIGTGRLSVPDSRPDPRGRGLRKCVSRVRLNDEQFHIRSIFRRTDTAVSRVRLGRGQHRRRRLEGTSRFPDEPVALASYRPDLVDDDAVGAVGGRDVDGVRADAGTVDDGQQRALADPDIDGFEPDPSPP